MKRLLLFILFFTQLFFCNYYSQTDSTYNLNVNLINVPVRADGILGWSYQDNSTHAIIFDSINVIWSAGFLMSGYSNENMWSNGNASAARVEDYVSGVVNGGSSKLYILKSSDIPFGDTWQDWIEAVELGAKYYDGDNNGVYNPVDLNSNGLWDETEDRPDLLGDETVWCVYNDGLPSEQRLYKDVEPQGIEIRQTVWASNAGDENDNVVYARYSIVNKGTVAQSLDSVYFGAWSDTDIGSYLDDLGGTDLDLNSVFVYNDSSDSEMGMSCIAHYMSLLQRPWQSTGNSDDEAYNNCGGVIGVDTIAGAINLKMTSSNQVLKYVEIHADPDTKEMARNILKGLTSLHGEIIDPCNWEYGKVNGMNCEDIPLNYIYSGDPFTNQGWINNYPTDTRMLANVGPFTLIKDEPKDIIVSHTLARKDDYLKSLAETKRIVSVINGNFITEVKKEQNDIIPKNYSLSQNYPNPFNPSTIIQYSISHHGVQAVGVALNATTINVTLKVYDILGREIATLVNKQQKPGNYEIKFVPNKNLSSGVYFYNIIAGSFVETKKMLLLR